MNKMAVEVIDLNFQVPETGTNSSINYYQSIKKDLEFFFFIINTVMVSDYIPYHAKKTLELMDGKISKEDIISNPDELMQKQPGKNISQLRNHSQEFLEMIFSRIVDNFQVYLVSLIREILHVKPEILNNKQPTISIEQILKVDSIGALIKEMIESKVTSLSNKGFGNIEEWCITNGIPLVVDKQDKDKIVEFIAIRNIIVHNRAIIDEKYMKAVPNSQFAVGLLRELDVNELYSVINILSKLVRETDEHSINKFGLTRITIDKESKFKVEF